MPYCKRLILFCLVSFCTLQMFAQSEPDITGLWKGTMYNDTTKQFLKYEIAISENKGKLSGYTHTYFILDDKEYHGVKKAKIKRKDGKIIVEDVELIANNYPVPPAKGVRQLDVLTLEIKDGVMILSGPFSTNRTKVYHSLTGNINVQRKTNFKQSALVPHLEELGLAEDLSFVQEEKMNASTAVVKKETIIEQPVVKTPAVVKEKPVETKPVPAVKKEETKVIAKTQTVQKPVEIKTVAAVKEKPAEQTVTKAPATTVVKNNAATTEKPAATINAKAEPVSAAPVVNAAVDIVNRKIETIQSVYYNTDSLELTLYDNGEVDGDTVSVLMNGEVIMPRVGLSTNVVRKKVSTVNSGDSIVLVMYAENLGRLPPNTGLLIVYDGETRHEIRFSGNLQKNAAIVFRRRQD
ncbi:MAG: hypothetical protein IPL50_04830 [Chitinophagaceae bacterium]|nr:hypothetical protein [Chitinophagaceae bacterium]